MIRNLDNRIKIYTILFIALFISFMALTSYSVFTKILTDDYIEKSVGIARQQSRNAVEAIKNIEETSRIIIADLNLDNPQYYKSHDSSYIGALASYGASSPYFTSFVVYRNKEILYYHIPLDNAVPGIRNIDYEQAVNIEFDQNGVGWNIAESNFGKDDFLLLVRKIPFGEDFIYIIFQVDAQYISDYFMSKNEFANHTAVLLKTKNSEELCRITNIPLNKKSSIVRSFEYVKNGEYTKNGKYSVLSKFSIQNTGFSFYIKDDISVLKDYTSSLALIYTFIFCATLFLAYFAVSLFSKNISSQFEKIRIKMQNYC